MTLTSPVSFREAIASRALRMLLPTSLGSAEIRQIDGGLMRQASIRARIENAVIAQKFDDFVASVLNPVQEPDPSRATPENPLGLTTRGLDPASVQEQAARFFKSINYTAKPGEEGTIKDLSSPARIGLIVRTDVELATGQGRFIQANDDDVLLAFPAQELFRQKSADKQRDWPERFRECAEAVGDTDALRILEATGQMIARKDSPIWDELGNPARFDDALGNPFAPFAFNSGMRTRGVGRRRSIELGLITPEGRVQKRDIGFDAAAAMELPKDIRTPALRAAIEADLQDKNVPARFDARGVLTTP